MGTRGNMTDEERALYRAEFDAEVAVLLIEPTATA